MAGADERYERATGGGDAGSAAVACDADADSPPTGGPVSETGTHPSASAGSILHTPINRADTPNPVLGYSVGDSLRRSPPLSILLVEPDVISAEPLLRSLRNYGHRIRTVRTGATALAQYHLVDLVLLDLELPDMDGLQICRTIRAVCDIPIITITARAEEIDRVLGLHAGSDDYLVKPCRPRELMARIDAVMRRVRPTLVAHQVISHGPLHINALNREVRLQDRIVILTPKEFDLLYFLASHPLTVIPRQQIMEQVWQNSRRGSTRTLDTHISSLRNKLGSRSWIGTIRGVGFQLGPVSQATGNSLT